VKCEHQKCHPTDRIYVPCHVDKEGKEFEKIKPHYYCEHCGEIEYIGPDKARGFGFFSNILGDIKRCLDVDYKKGGSIKITTTLLRLVALELNKLDDFTDKFSTPFSTQKREFYRILKKFIPSLSRDLFDTFFDNSPVHYDDADVNYYGKYYEDLEEEYAEELAELDGEQNFCFFS